MANLDKKAIDLRQDGVAFCWLTVVKVDGSAPRHVGSKMIVCEDGSIYGTIGGGGLENQAIKDAKELLKKRGSECKTYELTEDGIQPCGGITEIFIESISPMMPMIVFGAGHIAEKLIPMLVELGYDVTLVDERVERIELPVFSCVQTRVNELPSDFLPTVKFDDKLNLICITHMHVHDEEIVEYCMDKPFKYMGLISSRKKWAFFCDKYREKGFTAEQMARISTPIGLDIGAETPFEISVAIAAELIQLNAKPEDHEKRVGRYAV